jgi:hypothetical protein
MMEEVCAENNQQLFDYGCQSRRSPISQQRTLLDLRYRPDCGAFRHPPHSVQQVPTSTEMCNRAVGSVSLVDN